MRTALLLAALVLGCSPEPSDTGGDDGPAPYDGPNVLIVLLDDIGVDKVSAYGVEGAPPTPNIDALADQGIRFDRAYADPFCSASRAGLLTGRHAWRYGIGNFLTPNDEPLPDSERTLAEALHGYDSAAVGKFHLGGEREERPIRGYATEQGFGSYEGAPSNLAGMLTDGRRGNYFHYDRFGGDSLSIVDGYATTDVTDTALTRLSELTEPWLLHVGYHAAHVPLHVPPEPLNPLGAQAGDPDPILYDAMVASLDQEVGRLLDGLDPDVRARTLIVVMGDNGTPSPVATGEHEGLPGKASVYEGGTHVPLVVAGGPVGVTGATDALVSHVDLFATVLDLLEPPAAPRVPEDSVSFAQVLGDLAAPSARDHVYAEVFEPNGRDVERTRYDRMVRDERYKLMRALDGTERFFDLDVDPLERDDLIDQALDTDEAAALEALRLHMDGYVDAADSARR